MEESKAQGGTKLKTCSALPVAPVTPSKSISFFQNADELTYFMPFLSPVELAKIATINRLFSTVASTPRLWESYVKLHITEYPKLSGKQTYKDFYMTAYVLHKEIDKMLKKRKVLKDSKESIFSIFFNSIKNKIEYFDVMIRELVLRAIVNGYDQFPQWFPDLLNARTVNMDWSNSEKPIHVAAYYGHKNFIKVLIDMGADVNARNGLYVPGGDIDVPSRYIPEHGDSALSIAAMRGHQDCIALLIAHGANINQQPIPHGDTALHRAASNGHLGCLQELLQANALLDVPGEYGHLAIHLAMKYKHENCVSLLEEHMKLKEIHVSVPPEENFCSIL